MSADRDSLLKILNLEPPENSRDDRLNGGAIEQIGEALGAAAATAMAAGIIGPEALPAVRSATRQVVALVADALELRLRDILVSAWNKRQEIAKYADTTKYPPTERRFVQLYEHPITWTYAPKVQLLVGGVSAVDVKLEVKLTLKVDQAVLAIEGGRVMAIEPGKGKVEASAKIGPLSLCPNASLNLGDLPGTLSFAPDGIPIGRDPLAGSHVA